MTTLRTLVTRFALFLCGSTALADTHHESLSFTKDSGVKLLPAFSATPDPGGVVATFTLEPPPFDPACYWAPFQKYDPPPKGEWYDGFNRLQPLAVKQIAEMKQGGQSVLFRL